MSIKIGNNILAKSSTYHPDLFDVKWSDHIINNISWLRADTFSWHSGELYNRAYEHLLEDWNNSELSEEAIPGLASLEVRVAPDGHKMVSATNDGPERVQEVFETTGIAWYYIIDTENKRFKLPRTKFGFTGIRSGVGGYVKAGLPNITGSTNTDVLTTSFTDPTGALYGESGDTSQAGNSWGWGYHRLVLDASRSSSVYGNSDTVQPNATEMYLYFYVGNYAQSDLENVAGEMSEVLNNKADIDLLNILSNIDFVVESLFPTAENNYTWYRKYRSGWVEQGGIAPAGTSNISFPIEMADTNYCLVSTWRGNNTLHTISNSFSTTGCNLLEGQYATSGRSLTEPANWQVSGMAAQ